MGGSKGENNVRKQKFITICIIIAVILIGGVVIWNYLSQLFTFDSISDEDAIKSFKENKQVFIEAKDYILRNENADKILADSYDKQQKSLLQIFGTLKYRGIHKADKGAFVYFVRVSELGFTQGVIFSTSNNEPDSIYYTKLVKIEDGWYLYKAK